MKWLALAFTLLGGCGNDGTVDPLLFPDDYATTYQEVRACRFSVEHDLVRIRVLASPDALGPYTGRSAPFPTGAVVLKEEYDTGDMTCAGPIVNLTVMQKLDVGSSPDQLDWVWQKTDGNHASVKTDIARCARCHMGCGVQPEGYDGTCTVP